jgi:hypothetical protein
VKSLGGNTVAPTCAYLAQTHRLDTSEEIMRDENNTPEDMDALIGEVQAGHPSLAYMGPMESDPREWSEDELDAMGTAFLTGLVQMRI